MYADPFRTHTDAVEMVAAAGAPPPAKWSETYARFVTRDDNGDTALSRYKHAIITGTKDDLVVLRALALAEVNATNMNIAAVNNSVQAGVLSQLEAFYAPVARKNFTAVAAKYNDLAAEFTADAAIVDPTCDATELIAESDNSEVQAAWLRSAVTAKRLDETLAALAAAAGLAGLANAETPGVLLPLGVDVLGVPKRALWSAWTSTSRAGRWPEIVKLTQIRANQDPLAVVPLSEPLPLQERWVRDPNGGIGHVRELYDPELETA